VLWGGAIDIKAQRLASGAHGPRELLPGSADSRTERFRHRIDAWKRLAESVAAQNRITLCLVMARDFYSDVASGRPDDTVNKAAARKALAVVAGATVQ